MHLKWHPGCTETISKIVLTDSLPSGCRSLQHLSWYTGARKWFTCLSRKYNRILSSIYSLHMSIKTPTRWTSALSHGLIYTSKVHGSLSKSCVCHQLHNCTSTTTEPPQRVSSSGRRWRDEPRPQVQQISLLQETNRAESCSAWFIGIPKNNLCVTAPPGEASYECRCKMTLGCRGNGRRLWDRRNGMSWRALLGAFHEAVLPLFR